MQTVLIMAVGAMILIGLNGLFRQVSPKIQAYIQAAVSGRSENISSGKGGFLFDPSGATQGQGSNAAQPTRTPIPMRELLRQASSMAYTGKPGDLTSDGKWRIAQNGLVEDHTGFRAIILTPADGSNTGAIVAFAGTDVKSSFGGAINDLANNIEQTLTGVSPQYVRAVRLAEALKDRYGGNIYLTGHSLGGGQAALASSLNNVPGAGFNPAPLGGISAVTTAIMEDQKPSNFINYSNRFDPISNLHEIPYFPGRQVGGNVELGTDHGWPGFGLADHSIENMANLKK